MATTALAIFWPEPDAMGAPRLNADEKAKRFRQRFQALVPWSDLQSLAAETGLNLKTLQDWHKKGTSQPFGNSLETVARALGIPDPTSYFFDEAEPAAKAIAEAIRTESPQADSKAAADASTPQSSAAPAWLHQALDDAYASPHSDFVHMIVTWAARSKPTPRERTGA